MFDVFFESKTPSASDNWLTSLIFPFKKEGKKVICIKISFLITNHLLKKASSISSSDDDEFVPKILWAKSTFKTINFEKGSLIQYHKLQELVAEPFESHQLNHVHESAE